MNKLIGIVSLVGSVSLISLSAFAVPLKVVNVNSPAINCIFNAACKVTVTDTVSTFSWPSIISATGAQAKLQSRTFTGQSTASVMVPGAGKTAYLYRVMATKGGSTDCVTGLTMDFGPDASLDYDKSGAPSDVFVVTSGGLGTVGLANADRMGNKIKFTFAQAICNSVAQSTYFFGLSTKAKPESINVVVDVFGKANVKLVKTTARVPKH